MRTYSGCRAHLTLRPSPTTPRWAPAWTATSRWRTAATGELCPPRTSASRARLGWWGPGPRRTTTAGTRTGPTGRRTRATTWFSKPTTGSPPTWTVHHRIRTLSLPGSSRACLSASSSLTSRVRPKSIVWLSVATTESIKMFLLQRQSRITKLQTSTHTLRWINVTLMLYGCYYCHWKRTYTIPTIISFLGLVVRQIPWSYSIVYDENRKRWK